jgi:hypothetical protein
MQYALLIYSNPADEPKPDTPELGAYIDAFGSYTQMLKDKGWFAGGEALQPLQTASSVRVRDGKTQTTDGPFAETKEALGGFYLIDAENLDEAIEAASKIPTAKFGTIEVRPIMVWE